MSTPLPTHTLPLPIRDEFIAEFCRRWGIVELVLFGSVLSGDFRPDSDVDVLITFHDPDAWPDRAGMKREIEAIFHRNVALVYRRVIEASANYLLRQSILGSARVICAT
jgi:hypothetical protein